jgi:hypothetical protein
MGQVSPSRDCMRDAQDCVYCRVAVLCVITFIINIICIINVRSSSEFVIESRLPIADCCILRHHQIPRKESIIENKNRTTPNRTNNNKKKGQSSPIPITGLRICYGDILALVFTLLCKIKIKHYPQQRSLQQ